MLWFRSQIILILFKFLVLLAFSILKFVSSTTVAPVPFFPLSRIFYTLRYSSFHYLNFIKKRTLHSCCPVEDNQCPLIDTFSCLLHSVPLAVSDSKQKKSSLLFYYVFAFIILHLIVYYYSEQFTHIWT